MIKNKRGQVAVFIIVAIVIVVAVVLVYAFRDKIFVSNNSSQFSDVYQFYDDCVKQTTLQGLKIAGTQGGYIEVPKFEPGSSYAPFSSQLDFLGNPVPYWYYVSGNNVIKEQVPSMNVIQNQLRDYLNANLEKCDFSVFRDKGVYVSLSGVKSSVVILDTKVTVNTNFNMIISKGNDTSYLNKRSLDVDSKFGKFYTLANQIYNQEKQTSFLENYSLDTLYSYAPVTGADLSCSPKIWDPRNVTLTLKSALSANIGALKVSGNYYSLKDKSQNYFVVNGLKTDDSVNFMYNPSWPTRVEVWPVDNNLMIAQPVGTQQGMGILGFCYVPYHFVYDVYYPVLVQIYDGNELFQFPVSVVIDKTSPRAALPGSAPSSSGNVDELCNYKNTPMTVYTYDQDLNPVSADISLQCFDTKCNIGTTNISGSNSVLSTDFPQCVNGIINAKADGYTDAQQITDTNEPGVVNILMNKLYTLNLSIVENGLPFKPESGDMAIINFESDRNSFSVAYPQQSEVKLSEGYYNVTMQIYSGAQLTVPASTTSQCTDVLQGGILGFFGKTTQQCFDVNLPAQTISKALSAGGKTSVFLLNSDLKNANLLKISVGKFPAPTSLDQLQQNYGLYETQNLGVGLE